jgi:predicted MPP superfamily phosphohydrolase
MLGIVLSLLAWIGHTAILVYSLNWWYGSAVPHKWLTVIRYLHGALVVAFPIAVARTFGYDLRALADSSWSAGQWLLAAYLPACWLVSVIVLPVVTIERLRHRPEALMALGSQVIDMAARLGYRPAGRTGHWYLAYLPGNQAFQVEFTEKILAVPNLPGAWDGLTLLHLSDFHWIGSPDRKFFQEIMDECRRMEPDLVLLTGDVVDSPIHHRWIIPVLGRLKWRIAGLAIMGNHESWYEPRRVRTRLERLGFQMLGGRWARLQVRGLPLTVIGHEGPWFREVPDLSDCPDDGFRLCLSHTPDNIEWARRNRIDLMLSGHNHGGQIRFPVFGSALVPSRYSRRYDAGVFDAPPTVLHVTRGLSGQHPIRYNCRPEVAKLVLVSRHEPASGE